MTFLQTYLPKRLRLVVVLIAIAAVIITLQTYRDSAGTTAPNSADFAAGKPAKDTVRAISDTPDTANSVTSKNRGDSRAMDVANNHTVELKQGDNSVKPSTGYRTLEQATAAVQAVETKVYNTATTFFENESVDYEWAVEYEEALSTLFATQPGMDRVSVSNLECRSTMCRIIVFTPQSRDADYFTSVFYDALGKFEDGKYKTTAAIARNMANGVTAVYISRKHHALKFYQELTY